MSAKFHSLTVKNVRRETPEAVSIIFDLPEELREAYIFKPGQYLTLEKQINGEDVRRSYSICSGLDDNELSVAVKHVAGGKFSTFANETLAAGDNLEVMPPEGRFTVDIEPGSARRYVAIAAGSGITPILSLIKTILQREKNSEFFLLYGNKKSDTILFKDELEDLKDQFINRLSVFHVLSREEQDLPIHNGRIDAQKIEVLMTNIIPAKKVDHVFLCGPGTLITQAREKIEALGVEAKKIHMELFTPAENGAAPVSVAASQNEQAEESGQETQAKEVEIILDGRRHSLDMKEGESIIDSALRQGIDLPYSCKGGMCCTCRAKVVKGEVEMAVNYSLEPWELEAGFVLTCQSRPVSKPVVVDYDAT